MNKQLKVLVHGTGFAGQGHTDAFRNAGAEVVGIVGRTESVVKEVAQNMGIPYASTDWQQALLDCQPDIVSIGTPGGAHVEPIKQAIEQGCRLMLPASAICLKLCTPNSWSPLARLANR